MKKLLLIASMGLITIASKANDEHDIIKLADKDKQNSLFFKMSRNSNRIAIFEQLQSLVKVKSNKNIIAQSAYSTYDDVIEILGEPNIKIKNSSFIYTLNPSNGCKAIVEFDVNRVVVYIAVKDCN
jgi:hypothetical protein